MSDTPMEAASSEPDWIEVEADGFDEPLRMRMPKDDAVLLMMSAISKKNVRPKDITRYMNGILGMFDEDSRDAVEDRIMDFEDEFGLEDLSDVWGDAMEQWSARPTQQSSDSTPSRQNTGRKSTGRASVRASTSQRSARTGSSTSSTPGS